jgi:DNA-binding IclR family transcriptional regulator
MAVLKELGLHPQGLSLSQLAKRIDVPKTSLLSLMKALEEVKYVRSVGQVYTPGESAILLGNILADREPFSLQWILHELVSTTQETGLIAKLTENRRRVVYTAVEDSLTNGVRYSIPVGTENELYLTAPGKVFLAFFSPKELKAYIKTVELKPRTGKTITDWAVLAQQLEHVRQCGVATVREEPFEAVFGASAPVFDKDGKVAMAFVVAAPLARGLRKEDMIKEAVLDAARTASVVLGFGENYPYK